MLAGLDMDRIARFKNDKIGSFCSIRSNMKGKKRKQQKTNPFPFFQRTKLMKKGHIPEFKVEILKGNPGVLGAIS